MKLLAIRDISPSPFKDTLFRQSAVGRFIAFFLLLFISGGMFGFSLWRGEEIEKYLPEDFLVYWIAGVFGLMALIVLFYARAALRPSNWLLKFNSERMLIKFRSHLNDHFPAEDPAVIFLSSPEIEWIRKHRETLSSPQTDFSSTAEEISFWSFLELKLANTVDCSVLGQALQAERNRQAPLIGHTRTKHKHYPVKLLDGGILRLEWQGIWPKIDQAIKILGGQFGRQTEQHTRARHWNELKGQDLDDRILDLAERGLTVKAVALARIKYDYTLTEAKKFVDEIMKN